MTNIPTASNKIKQVSSMSRLVRSLFMALGIVTKTVVKRAKSLICNLSFESEVERKNWKVRQKYKDLRQAQKLLPYERISFCQRNLAFGAEKVCLEAGNKKSRYKGLVSCGSVWGCPVCAGRKASVRQTELKRALSNHKGSVWLMTLTMKHHRGEDIKDTLDAFKKAVKRFKQSTVWRSFPQVGHVSATEVTWNPDGGWHPHAHILMFCEDGETDLHPGTWEIEAFSKAWLKALKKEGREALDKIGLDLKSGESAGNYVAKWGMDAEMSRNDSKKGRDGSLTPFELLRLSRIEGLSDEEQSAFGFLFQSYYEAFKGRSQLTWSPGLKKKLSVDLDESDLKSDLKSDLNENILQEGEVDFRVEMTLRAWRVILYKELEVDLLIAARMGEYGRVVKILREALGEQTRTRARDGTGIYGVSIWSSCGCYSQ